MVFGQVQCLFVKLFGLVNEVFEGCEYFVGDFLVVDIMFGYVCWVGNNLGQVSDEMMNLKVYFDCIVVCLGFQKMFEYN